MRIYAKAVERLAQDCGTDRLTSSNLPAAILVDPGWHGWHGPYVTGPSHIRPEGAGDLWGERMKFDVIGNRVRVTSAGPDREFGTEDDIIVETTLPE
jgi:hypothetical protein